MAAERYFNSEAIVSTSWVASHLDDATVRLVESNGNPALYRSSHIPGSAVFDWRADQQSQRIRDVASRQAFEALMASRGIANDTTVIFYGDASNRYAAASYWLFKMYGHRDCRIMDGGRAKWQAEGRPFSAVAPVFQRTPYRATAADLSIRAFRDQVLAHIYAARSLLDVRSAEEFAGQPVGSQHAWQCAADRAGHIPTACNIPWAAAIHSDGTFKRPAELKKMYRVAGIHPDQSVIVYCHSGERSAHTWFVLTQLLGYPDVRMYDGSWSEWGNLVRAPIEWGHSTNGNRIHGTTGTVDVPLEGVKCG